MDEKRECFLKDYHHARKMMCSTQTAEKDVESALYNVAQSYFRSAVLRSDAVALDALYTEWEIRKEIAGKNNETKMG